MDIHSNRCTISLFLILNVEKKVKIANTTFEQLYTIFICELAAYFHLLLPQPRNVTTTFYLQVSPDIPFSILTLKINI